MTQALTAILDGTAYQARLFWEKAARLLDPNSPVRKVGFEQGPKGFDDIWVEYDPAKAPRDGVGGPLLREHLQCKWHASPGSFGYADLIDPEFINAASHSLLERAHLAQVAHAPDGSGVRFRLVTNWRIAQNDPMRPLIRSRSGDLDSEKLFSTKTDRSAFGEIRKAWRDHLKISEPELLPVAQTISFGQATDSLDDRRIQLDDIFARVGLRQVPLNESGFVYDKVIYDWMGQKRIEFDRNGFLERCRDEGLLQAALPVARSYGVKSFEHAFDRLEDHCEKVLDLVGIFDERYIRDEADWRQTLYPQLKSFLHSAAAESSRVRLALDAHITLAFATGSVLDVKSGRLVELEQRTVTKAGKMVWAPDDLPPDAGWPKLGFKEVDLDPTKPDLAIAVGITHPLEAPVTAYVASALPEVGKILVCEPTSGASLTSVACGSHAATMVEALAARFGSLTAAKRYRTVHLFIAAPNGLTVLLGQRCPLLGQVQLYEFDFGGGKGGSYTPSLRLPISS